METIKAKFAEFNLGGDTPRRRFINTTLTFSQIKRMMRVEVYSSSDNTGEQRRKDEKHVRKLAKAMRLGQFTPSPMTAGLRNSHLQSLTIDSDTKDVVLKIDPENPIPCLDGSHRWGALDIIYNEASPQLKKMIDACNFSVQILLDPPYVKQDFQRLQEGLKMDRTHILALALSDENVPAQKLPVYKLGKKVAMLLNHDEKSHLSNQVKFDSSDRAPIGLEKLMVWQGADLATSLVLGCKLAIKYNCTDENFLVNAYVSAYQAIREFGRKEEIKVGEKTLTEVALLQPDKILRPTSMSGSKGGTRMLNGIANCLTFRKLFLGEPTITTKDKEYLAKVADKTLDEDASGNLSNPRIRQLMGSFAREYFSDMKNQDGMVFDNGIPEVLVIESGKSTWNIDKDAVTEAEEETEAPEEVADEEIQGVDAPSGQADTDPEWHNTHPSANEEEPPTSPSPSPEGQKGKKNKKKAGVMA